MHKIQPLLRRMRKRKENKDQSEKSRDRKKFKPSLKFLSRLRGPFKKSHTKNKDTTTTQIEDHASSVGNTAHHADDVNNVDIKTNSKDDVSNVDNTKCNKEDGVNVEITNHQTYDVNGIAIITHDTGDTVVVEVNIERPPIDEITDHNAETTVETRDTSDCGGETNRLAQSTEHLRANRSSNTSVLSINASSHYLLTQGSLSNLSVHSRRYNADVDTRTVWTQTDTTGPVATADEEAGPSLSASLEAGLDDVSRDPSHWRSIDFGTDNPFDREPVINLKLAAIRDRIVYRLAHPDLGLCDASICVNLLSCPKVPFLIALTKRLSGDDREFTGSFLMLRGLDYLLDLMDVLTTRGLCDMYDVTMMLALSGCVSVVVKSPAGCEFMVAHGELVESFSRGKAVSCSLGRGPYTIDLRVHIVPT